MCPWVHTQKKSDALSIWTDSSFFFYSLYFWRVNNIELQRYSIFLAVPSLGVTCGLSSLVVLIL